MNYRDDECSPELGDIVEVYDENYPPERAQVIAIGKNKIKITYDDEYIKPRSEWVNPATCDMISREG